MSGALLLLSFFIFLVSNKRHGSVSGKMWHPVFHKLYHKPCVKWNMGSESHDYINDYKFAGAMEEKGRRKLLGADTARTRLCCRKGLGEQA